MLIYWKSTRYDAVITNRLFKFLLSLTVLQIIVISTADEPMNASPIPAERRESGILGGIYDISIADCNSQHCFKYMMTEKD
jgi:hypothetical protein